MVLEELVGSFIYSRRHGIKESGAKKKASQTTLDNYEQHLKVFTTFLQDERKKFKWEDVGKEDVRAYIETVNARKNWSEATKLSLLRTLRTLMVFIDKDEECRDGELRSFRKMMPAIPRNPSRRNIPSPVDLKKWRNAFDLKSDYGFRNYVAFSTWLETGIRNEELSGMRLDWLSLDDSRIYVIGKSGPRNVSITDKLVRLLRIWLKRRATMRGAEASPYVFISQHGERVTPNGFGQAFRKLRKANPNLPRVFPHLLRHSFGTYYLKRGGNLERLRLMLGHTTYHTTQGYLHLAEVTGDEAREELERVSPLGMLDEVRVK